MTITNRFIEILTIVPPKGKQCKAPRNALVEPRLGQCMTCEKKKSAQVDDKPSKIMIGCTLQSFQKGGLQIQGPVHPSAESASSTSEI